MNTLQTTRLQELEKTRLHDSHHRGQALMEIRDSRLYLEHHDTFEEYVKSRWGMSRRRAYQLIDSAEVSDALGTTVHTPASESVP